MEQPATSPSTSLQALFNNSAFAEVVQSAHALTSSRNDSTVTTRLIAADTRLGDSVVRPVITRLLAADLLGELPKTGAPNGPRYLYRRNEPRWNSLLTLIETFHATAPREQQANPDTSTQIRRVVDPDRPTTY